MNKVIKCAFATIVVVGVLSCGQKDSQEASFYVIPAPQEMVYADGEPFELKKSTTVTCDFENAEMKHNAIFLAEHLGLMSIRGVADRKHAINLSLGLKSDNPEAYRITVSEEAVDIQGSSPAGVFYGIQTLRKAIPADWTSEPARSDKTVNIPAIVINDAPRFAYRGAHFDPVRHFFTVDEIKTFIDMMALHNMNTFHWHLTDDQGWRIEIKKYPELTKVGAYRPNTAIGHVDGGHLDPNAKYDDQPVSGFYTQKDAKEIIKYAAKRYITVIPEIEIPGHMVAALTTYPELGCTGGPYEVWRYWGVSEHILCVGKPATFDFIDNVLSEIVDIFPSEYIHIGGDEAPKTQWKKCPRCQAFIKELGLKDENGISKEDRLQGYVTNHVEQFLAKRGRKIIGWDEILYCGVSPTATVMSWRGVEGGIDAARQGNDVIMAPTSYYYFDYYQSPDRSNEPDAIGGNLPLAWVYSFNPMPDDLTPEEQEHIIGVQANLWTEYIATFSHAQYMLLPRWAALAEAQWSTQDKKDYTNFFYRLPQLYKWYDKEGYNYARHAYNVNGEYRQAGDQELKVRLFTVDDAPIHYTLDGSVPTVESAKYVTPFTIPYGTEINAIVVREDGNSPLYHRQASEKLLSIKEW